MINQKLIIYGVIALAIVAIIFIGSYFLKARYVPISWPVSLSLEPISWESMNGPPGGRISNLIQNPYHHNELYATTNHGVYKSEDKGEHWKMMNKSKGINVGYVGSIAAFKDKLFVCGDGLYYYDAEENLIKPLNEQCNKVIISDNKLFVTFYSQNLREVKILYTDLTSDKFDWKEISFSESELKDLVLPPKNIGYYIGIPNIVAVGNRILVNVIVEVTGSGQSGEFTNGHLYVSENFGDTWSRVDFGIPKDIVIANIIQNPNNLQHIILTFKHNIMHEIKSPVSMLVKESHDGGKTWSPVTDLDIESNGITDADIVGSVYYLLNPFDSYMLKLDGSRSERINMPVVKDFEEVPFSLYTILFDFDDPKIVYGTTGPVWSVGMIKSEDGMKTWKKMDKDIVESSRTIVVVNPRNSNTIFTSGNVIQESYLTRDGGKTWEPFSPTNAGDEVRIDPFNLNHILVISEMTYIFESYDGGRTFKSINQDFSSAKIFDFEIAKDNSGKIYASNIGIGISEYDPQGNQWRYLIGSPDYMYDFEIDPEDSNALYAAYSPKIFENHSSIWKYSKNQKENFGWSEIFRVENSAGITSLKFDPNNPNKLYAGMIGEEGEIYVTNDKGKTWDKLNDHFTMLTVWGQPQLIVDPNNSSVAYAGTWLAGTWKTTDAGKTWTLLEDAPISSTALSLDNKNTNIIYLADRSSPTVWKSADAGKTWKEVANFAKDRALLVMRVLADGDTVYASTFYPSLLGGKLYKSTDAGRTWSDTTGTLPVGILDIAIDPTNSDIVYLTTNIHGAYRSIDGGVTWNKMENFPDVGAYDIEVDIDDSKILYTAVRGGSMPSWFTEIAGVMGGINFTDSAGVYKSTDSGETWSSILTTSASCRVIRQHPDNPNLLFANDVIDGLQMSVDAGKTWTSINTGLENVVTTAVAVNGDKIYVGTQGSGVYSGDLDVEKGIVTWQPSRSNKPIPKVYNLQIRIDPTNSNNIFISSYPGGLYASTNGGVTFSDRNAITPSVVVDDPIRQGYYTFVIDPNDPKKMWLGTWGKGIYKSYNSMILDVPANLFGKHINQIIIDPDDSNTVYVATMEGVFVTKNDGKSWEEMNDGLQTLDIKSLRIARTEYPPFNDDFEDGDAKGWEWESGWSVTKDNGNYVFQGIGHKMASAGLESWTDYTFESKVRLIQDGLHVNYRVSDKGERYFIGVHEWGLFLARTIFENNDHVHTQLVQAEASLEKNTWYAIKIVGKGNNIKVYVNNELKIDYTDDIPVLNGRIAFESLDNSTVYVDDIHVTLDKNIETEIYAGTAGYGIYRLNPLIKKWQNLGRTLGSGWWSAWERRMYQFSSILFDPDIPGRVYYGHFPSGFFISEDNGKTWKDSSLGLGNDGMFSLSVHPLNHSILFAGTYNGVAKSVDSGKTWELKSNGMPSEQWPYTVAIDSNNPNIMYTSTKNGQNKGFCDRNQNTFCGVVMKSTDGGETWFKIMNGLDDKNEFYTLLIYPPDHNILFLSTNKGVYLSRDAGKSWKPANNGLPSTNNQVRDNVAENLALTPDNKYLILGLVEYGLWKADLSNFGKVTKIEVKTIPKLALIDGHAHFFSGGDAVQNADSLVEEMDNANVSKAVLYGGCDQPYFDKSLYVNGIREEADSRVLKAYEKYPNRFYPVLSGFDPQNPNSADYLEQQLATGIWKGLGEIYMIQFSMLDYKTVANHPNMMKIYRVLAKYNVPIFFHYERRTKEDVDAIYGALEQNPDVKFVWVHFANTGPDEIENELVKYPNLYVLWEIGGSKGSIGNKNFVNLLEKYPNRFMIGSDVGCMENNLVPYDCREQDCISATYEDGMAIHREFLSELSPQTAERIAYKNLEELMS
jgi:photosystem II stability/assembly factor-like uncharacterized protein/predicted TIM-barrel fold metal-dependent hydrolase